jgi:hypothetical protein
MSLGWNVCRSMSGPIGTLMGFGVISSALMRRRSSIPCQGRRVAAALASGK